MEAVVVWKEVGGSGYRTYSPDATAERRFPGKVRRGGGKYNLLIKG